MIYNMRGDTYHAGPVMLSDVYTSAVGSAKDGVAASQRALYDAYNSLNSSKLNKSDFTGCVGPQTIVDVSGTNTIKTYLDNKKLQFKSYVYTNWGDSTNFPSMYGSGLMIACLDTRFKKSIYIWDTGGGVGCAVGNIYNIGSGWIFNWRSI